MSKGLENMKAEYSKLQQKNDTINQRLLTFSQGDVTKEEETRAMKASVATLNAKVILLQLLHKVIILINTNNKTD